MKSKLSLLLITKNSAELLEKCLDSVKDLVTEIVAVDDYSIDETRAILRKYGAKIYNLREENLGKKRAYGLKKATNDWVLVLDSDEILSDDLQREISSLFNNHEQKNGYIIPFQNHFLGKPVNYGGENYKKLPLFNRKFVSIKPALVHENFKLTRGMPGELKNKIKHYSYRSLKQMFGKFTDYSVREARQKIAAGEKPSLSKVFTYSMHMFWARFVKDKGYKDGLFRIPLDLGFAYMEMMTYILLFLLTDKKGAKKK